MLFNNRFRDTQAQSSTAFLASIGRILLSKLVKNGGIKLFSYSPAHPGLAAKRNEAATTKAILLFNRLAFIVILLDAVCC